MSKQIILSQNNEFIYVLNQSTKEVVDELTEMLSKKRPIDEQKYPFIKEIDSCGHISEVFNQHVKDYIPVWKVKQGQVDEGSKAKIKMVNEYFCYANKEKNYIIIHEDALSSFRCACNCIHAEYFYVIRNLIEETKEVEHGTRTEEVNIPDSNRDTEVCEENTSIRETKSSVLPMERNVDSNEGETSSN